MPKMSKSNLELQDKRAARHAESVRYLFRLMEDCLQRPQQAPQGLLIACRTQSSLAKFELKSRKIVGMSLNTMKSISAHANFEGGWDGLNLLRKKLNKLNVPVKARPPKISDSGRQGQDGKVGLQSIVDDAFRSRTLIYRAYIDLLNLAKSATSTNPHLAERLSQHTQTFRVELGLSPVPKAAPEGGNEQAVI